MNSHLKTDTNELSPGESLHRENPPSLLKVKLDTYFLEGEPTLWPTPLQMSIWGCVSRVLAHHAQGQSPDMVALWRQRQEDLKFKVVLGYIVSLRPFCSLSDPASKETGFLLKY